VIFLIFFKTDSVIHKVYVLRKRQIENLNNIKLVTNFCNNVRQLETYVVFAIMIPFLRQKKTVPSVTWAFEAKGIRRRLLYKGVVTPNCNV
jgi:hypothetical protein